VLGAGLPRWRRTAIAVLLLAVPGSWAAGEVAALAVLWATAGAATGWWSGPSALVFGSGAAAGFASAAGLVVWLVLWTAGGTAAAGSGPRLDSS
jgi:hypothetical protein